MEMLNADPSIGIFWMLNRIFSPFSQVIDAEITSFSNATLVKMPKYYSLFLKKQSQEAHAALDVAKEMADRLVTDD